VAAPTPAGALWIDFLDFAAVVSLTTFAWLVLVEVPKVSDAGVTGGCIDNDCKDGKWIDSEVIGGRFRVGPLAARGVGAKT